MSVYFSDEQTSALNEMLGFLDDGEIDDDAEYKKQCLYEMTGALRFMLLTDKYERVVEEAREKLAKTEKECGD